MSRHLFAVIAVLVVIAALAGTASANPWPNYSSSGSNTFPFSVTTTPVSGGFNYDVTLNGDAGDTLREFIVYYGGISTASPPAEGWTGYDGGNTAGFTSLNGGWEWGRMGTPDSAALGWKISSASEVVSAAATSIYTFRVRNLPSDFVGTPNFVVHYGDGTTGNTFFARGDRNPSETPEPGSLALLGLGLATGVGVIRRRKKS
jgi:PEP-CTERM motif